MSGVRSARGPGAIKKFLNPQSVAIVGISSRPGGVGHTILKSLKLNEFKGDIHLIGRSAEPIDGRRVLSSPAELPIGVDLAVLAIPAAGVRDAVLACVGREVGSALIFAAGFAETGHRDAQQEIERIAREGGLAIVGPNCLGFTNNVNGLMMHMLFANKAKVFEPNSKPGVALIGQSGGIIGHFQRALDTRSVPMSYVVTLGNEGGLDLADFVDFLTRDAATRVIALYAEQVRRPAEFLEAVKRARAAGKPVVMMHSGQSNKAKLAVQSHTGALAADYEVMRAQTENAGACLVDSMDELTDLVELLARNPTPPSKGPGIVTASGAYVAIANDFAESVSVEFPQLEPATLKSLRDILPPFGNYGNPLDVTAGASTESFSRVTKILADDPNIGSILVSFPIGSGEVAQQFAAGLKDTSKAAVIAVLGDGSPLGPDVCAAVKDSPAVFSRSSDRSLRALANLTRYGQLLEQTSATDDDTVTSSEISPLVSGALPEWQGKKIFEKIGIPVPRGALANTVEAAIEIAARIGFPVALKAQSAILAHKTEAGAVKLNIANDDQLRSAWTKMLASIQTHTPGLVLDGFLVEKMGEKGLEMMVGAKRDSGWGTVLLLGLGGVWAEALGDVRLLPVDASKARIINEYGKLRSARLLNGFRGAPPVDIDALAETTRALGRLMQARPEIVEIDVNPLVAHAQGKGVTALDALIVCTSV